jgi:hypothetical protein
MRTNIGKDTTLSAWLSAVNAHLDVRRDQVQTQLKPKRNRERERARREARQLFAEFRTEQVLNLAS